MMCGRAGAGCCRQFTTWLKCAASSCIACTCQAETNLQADCPCRLQNIHHVETDAASACQTGLLELYQFQIDLMDDCEKHSLRLFLREYQFCFLFRLLWFLFVPFFFSHFLSWSAALPDSSSLLYLLSLVQSVAEASGLDRSICCLAGQLLEWKMVDWFHLPAMIPVPPIPMQDINQP
ncbi:hypothetical protein VTN77DRAFT_2519 [Rasamsonia byssochlamydoides]|uniref:uncharacterized protein n=1 Tax=Rasamsonia byssochlamydoides TaxID=89139 RepID=UPI003743053D